MKNQFTVRIFSFIVILSMLLSAVGIHPASAAGSTRVMCEADTSLVGCWRMEEGSGTTLYDGGASPFNDVSLLNTPTFSTPGKVGNYSISLNGANQYGTSASETSLSISGPITIAAWVYTTKTGTQYVIKKAANGATDGYELSLATTGYAFVRFNQKTSTNLYRVDALSPNSYPINTWFHLAATYDGSTTKLYMNGVLINSGVGPQTIAENSLPLSIGAESTGVSPLSGKVDDARIYNRALSASEIAALAGVTPPGDTTAPTAPTALAGTPGDTSVGLTWTSPADPDVKGYNVYRSLGSPVDTTTPINGALVTTESYNDTGLTNGTPYFYAVKAVDTSGNVSAASNEATATPLSLNTPPVCYGLTLGHNGNGSTPTALPTNSSGCPVGQYAAGELINLSNAAADAGWQIASWYGTSNDASTANTNSLTMPANAQTAGVNYTVVTAPAYALQFDGSNDYVNLTAASGLGAQHFTVETWFKRTAAGTSISTGSNGVTLVPLIAKGAPQADGTSVDENYVLGIRASDNVLAGDFEIYAACAGRSAGDNNPIVGVTPILNNTWYHAAFTYDGTALRLYLNGNLEKTLASTCIPRYDNSQPAALGTTLTTAPLAQGFFAGVLDEARIWSVARTQAEIRADINNELASGTDLLARWGMDEGSGTTVASSVGTFPGTLTNGTSWVTPGAPFNITFDTTPPASPTGLTALGANMMISLDWADNSEVDLAGYNIYRGTTSGTYTRINSSLVTASAYSDSGLVNGTEYYYVVRAVDTSGNESSNSNEGYAIPTTQLGSALQFNGSSQYVTFGVGNSLSSPTYTVETWFMRKGAGVGVTTGGGGISSAIPLITKGTSESETAPVDINYFLGIDASTGQLIADFEEGAGGASPSQNHPVTGTTVIDNDVWYHAAMTYDGTTLKIYLNGKQEGSVSVGQPAASGTTSPTAFATSIRSNGTTIQGYFDGVLDEVRIWNVARSQTEILSTINEQITSGTGLMARWGLNEGAGSVVASSVGSFPGTLTGGPAWVPGAPFNLNITPAVPALVMPADLATGISTSPTLRVHVTDPQNSPVTVSFFGRPKDGPAGADFTLIAIPDPQNYAATYPAIYNAQMNWVVANKTASNIKYVMSLGDNVNLATGDPNSGEWLNAKNAWDLLTAGGVPYGLGLGNHDGAPTATANFNTAFGSRIASQPTYGGRYGTSDYDNTYATFTASGMEFIVLYIEYDTSMTSPSNPVLAWANGILAANPNKRAIVVTHDLLNGNNFTAQASAIYSALQGNQNLFLMLGGHLDTTGRRQEVGTNGNVVYALRSDYQSVDSQQSGYLRILRFSPADNLIHVTTYSPNQNKSYPPSDTNNTFDLAYSMDGAVDYTLIDTTTVASGSDASIPWPGLQNSTDYEWYAVADNGGAAAVSPTWSFTTEVSTNHAPAITENDPVSVTMSEDGSPTAFGQTLHATDADDDTLTWSISSPASHGTASAAGTGLSNEIAYSPAANYSGSDSFVVQVSDGNGGSDTLTLNVTITAVNDAPLLTYPGAQTSAENDVVSLQVQASDVDLPAQPLTYSASGLPQGLGINSSTGLISGTVSATASSNSPYNVDLGVSDGNGGSATTRFTWTITHTTTAPADLTCTPLQPIPLTTSTGEKPQSKVWNYSGAWYAVFPTNASGASSAGTWLWKLQGTTWTPVLKLSDRTDTKADVKPLENVAHILLYAGTNTQLVSVEYSSGTYQLWTSRPAPSALSLSGSEIATIDIDSTGRMWLATENDATDQILVYYSNSPYSTWSTPIPLATGVNDDDISVITKLPNQIGVLWSNQNTKRFGFRVHNDAEAVDLWSSDEVPAAQSAMDNVGLGMADDHLNVKVASDGTLYAAVKTSYDTAGHPKVALLVRRSGGTWDNLYSLGDSGTRGNIELDEANGVLTYIYTQAEGFNPIVYKQSRLSPISFGTQKTLRSESFNDVSSTRQTYHNELVVIYGSSTQVGGQICTGAPASGADLAITKTDGAGTLRPGDTLTYTIQVTNHGPQAVTSATVTDTLPSTLKTISWTCTGAGGGTCTASGAGNLNDSVNLPLNASVTYLVSATLDLGARGTLANTASVAPPSGITDAIPSNNTATDTDTIVADGTSCGSDPALVGCWQMEEGSGSTVLVDGSSSTNDANVVGAPLWAAGKVGTYALDLNGTSQYAYVPDDASLDLSNAITLAAWIKPERYETQDIIKKATNGIVNGYELTLATTKTDSSSQRAFFRINQVTSGDTYRINATTMYPTDGTWMHVAATFDGTTMKLYINGVLESSLTVPAGTTIVTNSLPLTIGAQDGTTASRWFMGWLDDTRVYNRALSVTEIQTLFGDHPPVAVDDAYETDEDTALNVTAPGVLGNDTDPESQSLTAIKVTDPANGTLDFSSDGSLTYTPNHGFRGVDTFTYRASDGQLESGTATVTVTVNAVNHAPVLDPIGNKTVHLGSLLSFTATASDGDGGDVLSFSLNNEPQGAAITSGGVFSWTPTQGQAPNTYHFDVCVSDGTTSDCETITVTVDIFGVFNKIDPPQGAILETFEVTLSWGSSTDAIRYEYCLDTSVNRLCNTEWISTGSDTQVALSNLENDTTYSWQVRAINPEGTVYANNDIWWQFTIAIPHEPGAGFAARLPDNEVHGYGWPLGSSVTLTIDDPDNGTGIDYTDTQTVIVADWDPNQTFVPFRVWQDGFELQPGQFVKLTDRITTKTHTITQLAITAIDATADTISGTAEAGSLVEVESISCRQVNCSGLRFVNADENGVWIADFAHVGSRPDEQDLMNLTAGMTGEARQADIDHDATTVPWSIQASLIINTVGNGSVTLDPPGGKYDVDTVVQLTPVPDVGWVFAGWSGDLSGTDTPVTLTMDTDKLVTATFNPLNIAPVAVDDTFITDEDVPLNIAAPGVLSNDTDAGPLTAILISGPDYGTLTLNPDGSFVYKPDANSYGVDYFTYKANDGELDSMPATVSVTVHRPLVELGQPVGMLTSWDHVFRWTGIAGGTWYKIEVQNALGEILFTKWYGADSICTRQDCSVKPEELSELANGTYQWRIQDYGAYGYGVWTDLQEFTLNTSAAGVRLGDPAGIMTSWDHAFDWTGVAGGTWYQLEVQDAGGSSLLNQWYTADSICVGQNCSVRPAETLNLTNGTYQWRIRDYGAYGYGVWTGLQEFTLNISSAGATLGDPSGIMTSWDHAFDWTGVAGGTWYYLEVQDAGGSSLLNQWYTADSICVGQNCSVRPAETLNLTNGTYQWRIRDYGAYGYGTLTALREFTLNISSAGAILGDPSGIMTSWDHAFHWVEVNGGTWYQLEVQDAAGNSLLNQWYTADNVCVAQNCSVSPMETLSLANGTYQWRLRDYGAYGYGVWTGLREFTLNISSSGAMLGDPSGTLTSWDHAFDWTGVAGGTWYQLEVQDANGQTVHQQWYGADSICVGQSCSVKPSETLNLANGTYSWRIQDYGHYGYGTWTPNRDFTLNLP